MAKRRRKKDWSNSEVDSELELKFLNYWVAHHPMARPKTQHMFHPTRKFRFDFCWLHKKVALEVQGYGPGHNSLLGMTQDYDKHLEAIKLNWTMIYITSIHLSPSRIDDTVKDIAGLLDLNHQHRYIPYSQRS